MPDFSWTCPAGVFTIALAGIGAAGGGRPGGGTDYGQNGGGGGAYSRKRGLSVTPGSMYLVRQGTATGPGGNGGETLFVTGATFRAAPGIAGQFGAPGTRGKAIDSVGDICYDGGDGGFADQFYPATQPAGGGGGGAGGPDAAGVAGSIPGGGLSGAGAASGGAGGAGNGSVGSAGVAPGGGGGGGGGNFSAAAGGGDGSIAIYDDTGSPADPYASSPIYLQGVEPPKPAAPAAIGRSYSFIM